MDNQYRYLFAGDSITDWFDTDSLLPEYKIQNVGVAGDCSLDLLERINYRWFTAPSDYIFICIGANDLARRRSPEEIIETVEQICKKMESFTDHSKIVLTSIFPVRNNAERMNDDINQLNDLLKQLTEKHKYCYFNLYNYFVDENGMLKEKFSDDGLHLTNLAYLTWAEIFRNSNLNGLECEHF